MMSYLVLYILLASFISIIIATPLAIMTVRWAERKAETPGPLSDPIVEPAPMTPERVDRIARRGRR